MKVIRRLGLLLLAVAVLAGGFAALVAFKPWPHHATPKVAFEVRSTPEKVAQGRRIALMLCAECHLNRDTGVLSGADIHRDQPFGKVYSFNITRHPTRGIGSWSDGELAYLLRTGVARDGRYTPPWMTKLPYLADDDLESVIAFLRSDDPMLKASDVPSIPAQPSFWARLLVTLEAFKPLPYPDRPIVRPPATDRVAWGRYLAINLECWTCHSEDFSRLDSLAPEKTPRFFQGGNPIDDGQGHVVYSTNLTPDVGSGIGSWSEYDFVRAVRQGVRPDHTPIRAPMAAYTVLTVDEAGAIYAFLNTLTPSARPRFPQPAYEMPPTADTGQKLFFKYGCNGCHAENGKGLCDLTANKVNHVTDEDLITFIRNPALTHPDTRMPSWENIIPPEEMTALVQHVRALAKEPGASPHP